MMKDVGLSEPILRRKASNRLMLRWLKTIVVSDEEKAPCQASGGDREGERKRIVADVSKRKHLAPSAGWWASMIGTGAL
jgi:hypothetical protein